MFVFDAQPISSIPIIDHSQDYPVRRIFCVGRNYADHAREMGADPDAQPCFFCKPADAIVKCAADGDCRIPYPSATQAFEHEVELVVALGPCRNGAAQAYDIFGYAVGIDLTRRDLQRAAKKEGLPWDMAKGFDNSAPLSPLMPIERCGRLSRGRIALSVNGDIRQKADLAEMIWPVEDIIARLGELVSLRAGDLIFTGTPAGVGPLARGDKFRGEIERVGVLSGDIF